MSALYGLTLIGIWLGLTTWFWKVWRRVRAQPDANRGAMDALGILFAAMWLGVSFWYGGGRTIYYDTQVRELCAKDGGVKVYETVKLPPDRFDQWGMVKPYLPTQKENALGPEYIFKSETTYYRKGNPEMWRAQYRVIRRADGKVLGETVLYGRAGGDLPGPWQPSGYRCPEVSQGGPNVLLKSIFVQSTGEH